MAKTIAHNYVLLHPAYPGLYYAGNLRRINKRVYTRCAARAMHFNRCELKSIAASGGDSLIADHIIELRENDGEKTKTQKDGKG